MLLLYFFYFLTFILKVYSSWYNSGPEELSALISSSCDQNGNIIKNGDGSYYVFNLSNDDNNPEYGGIVEIIPGLNVIKNKYMKMIEETNDESEKQELLNIMNMLINEKFKKLNNLSKEAHDNFPKGENDIITESNFDKYDVIGELIKDKNNNNKRFSIFNNNGGNIKINNIFFPADDVRNDYFREAINDNTGINEKMFNKNLEHDFKYENILKSYRINENNMKTTMNKMYDSSSKEYINRRKLFEKCAELCKSINDCVESFASVKNKITKEIQYKTDFFIVESTEITGINNKDEIKELYSFIINSPKKREVIHAGTLKKVIDEKGNVDYEKCDEYEYSHIKFDEITDQNENYNKQIQLPRNKYINP